MTKLRKLTVIFLAFTLCWTSVACGRPSNEATPQAPQARNANTQAAASTQLSDGEYQVQQATYDDGTGEYTLFLLNTKPGTPPRFTTPNLQMARLTD